jgi:hypothetical protein
MGGLLPTAPALLMLEYAFGRKGVLQPFVVDVDVVDVAVFGTGIFPLSKKRMKSAKFISVTCKEKRRKRSI